MHKTIGAWGVEVKKALLEKGLTQNELARELGYGKVYVSSIINGRVKSDGAKQKISDYLNVDNELSSTS